MLRIYGCITGQHDLRLVALAVVICLFACFTAVDLFARARDAGRGPSLAWMTAAAAVFGAGVWATHFIAELAYRPSLPIGYDGPLTGLSIAVALVIAWLGLFVAFRKGAFAAGGALIGASVGAMHYTGMAALEVPARIAWDGAYVAGSLAAAVAGAALALQLLAAGSGIARRLAAAGLLALAICGLHFTAMAAVVLTPDPTVPVSGEILAPTLLAVAIGAVTVLIVGLGLSGSLVDEHLARAATREAGRLRRSEEHLARAQRITHIGSIERDFATGQVAWSAETFRIFGLDPAAPVPEGNDFIGCFHPDERAAWAAALADVELGRPPPAMQGRIIRPDGTICWVHHECDVVRDTAGAPARWIGTFMDVTAAHQAEERQRVLQEALRAAKTMAETAARAVQAANDELERRVEARTAELVAMQDELLKRERLSALGQLTATVAHELRNPLSAIKNTVYTVKEIAAAKGVSLDRPLARLERSVHRCNEIIADLLDYSHLRTLSTEDCVLDPWLGDVLGEQPLPADIRLVQDLGAGKATVRFDPERFRRVIINLVDNAAQALAEPAMAGRERQIALGTRDRGEIVEIAIEDTGPGIAPENLEKVFEPLFSTKSFGTGLGLPTVRQIVEQHGGTVEIASQVGAGTRVLIRLPRSPGEIAA